MPIKIGCLCRAAAVLLFNHGHILGFLFSNPHISNKLACLVRELFNLPHLKVIYSAFAIPGIQLIEPFYARTIATGTTHSDLKVFYKELYNSLVHTKVDSNSLNLIRPMFPGVSEEMFKAVKQSYGEKVVDAVVEVAEEQGEDVVILLNHILPELAITLARHRRDYSLDTVNFPAEFPVKEQAGVLDDTPTNNMDMERLMGLTGQRLKKLQTFSAASRSIMLKSTRALKEASEKPSFRSFRQREAKRELEVKWNQQMLLKKKNDAERKQEATLGLERKRFLLLEQLKQSKGPFTNAEEVEMNIPEKEKQARMKKEVQLARDSSTMLPRVNQLFKIQVGLHNV